ncbi:catalase [Colletotrichum caudatum]|nr:catalase [Colletotrichum caudatum]
MHTTLLLAGLGLAGLSSASCPFADPSNIRARAEGGGSRAHLAGADVDDLSGEPFLTSDVGGPIGDQVSLKAGVRGSTLLEDFIFRQKITHFDHERVPERAVHARGAGAYGTFTSYGDFGNLTAASFLSAAGKNTSTFVRFSTVAGSRGSSDTARDVHGFATRFFTDQGNFDIVGNNIPVFFIQDAIQFPDLVHAVKPRGDNEIPQAATAHDSAWDFFSSQTTTLHTLFWAMAGYGIPRSYRHMDGFGVHTFRAVTNDGKSKFIKWHWKTLQGKASLVWEEAQIVSGKNADFHRQDLFDAIASGNGPEWELAVQVIDESDALKFGFDLLDPTKIVPVEIAPLQKLGKMKLDTNPVNYFAETEQIMFQPGHIVRGIDFTEDPLLQGRIFSYLDTQINRHGGPNFEQLPINRPITPVHNNNRDGAAQNFIHRNRNSYFPNALNKNLPKQANQAEGNGFFTAPGRAVGGTLVREISNTFSDHWSQPRLFYNSLTPIEQQFLVNAIRFETSHIESEEVRKNVVTQLNRVSNEVAGRVADALGLEKPKPDPQFYHNNSTKGISIFGEKLPTIATLKVGVLTSVAADGSVVQGKQLREAFTASGVVVTIVGERLGNGVDMTYSQADATAFDGVIVTNGAQGLFDGTIKLSALYPLGRPAQLVIDSYRWGKPVGSVGKPLTESAALGIRPGTGVFASPDVNAVVAGFKDGLATFRFTDRFATD